MKSQSKVGDNVFLFCLVLVFVYISVVVVMYCVINDIHIVYHFVTVTVSVHSNFHNFNWPPIHFDFFVTPIVAVIGCCGCCCFSSLSPSRV